MKIKTVAVLGAGAVGSYVIWGTLKPERYPVGRDRRRGTRRKNEKRMHH